MELLTGGVNLSEGGIELKVVSEDGRGLKIAVGLAGIDLREATPAGCSSGELRLGGTENAAD